MGISRDSAHKRRATGGKHKRIRMKRKFEMGRQPASTKIGEKKITRIRVRGGNYKFRALKLDHGNFAWAGEAVTRKTRVLKVVYNSTNNELVRTNTLVKGSIIQIDSAPYKAWYTQYYNIDLSNKKEGAATKLQLKVEEKKDEKGAKGKKVPEKKMRRELKGRKFQRKNQQRKKSPQVLKQLSKKKRPPPKLKKKVQNN